MDKREQDFRNKKLNCSIIHCTGEVTLLYSDALKLVIKLPCKSDRLTTGKHPTKNIFGNLN